MWHNIRPDLKTLDFKSVPWETEGAAAGLLGGIGPTCKSKKTMTSHNALPAFQECLVLQEFPPLTTLVASLIYNCFPCRDAMRFLTGNKGRD